MSSANDGTPRGDRLRVIRAGVVQTLSATIDAGIAWAAESITPDPPPDADRAITMRARELPHGAFQGAPGAAELIEGAFRFGVGEAVLLTDSLSHAAHRTACDWLATGQRLLSEAFLALPKTEKHLVFEMAHEVAGARWAVAIVGANAVSHLTHHARKCGLVVAFPTPEEDAWYKIDLFVRTKGNRYGFATQVKAMRGTGVRVIDRTEDADTISRVFSRLQLYNDREEAQWMPLLVEVGVERMPFADFDGSHDLLNAIRYRVLPLLTPQ